MPNNTTKCKSCDKEVAKTARTCPHCGQKNPGFSTAIGCLIIIGIAVGIAAIILL